MTNTLYYGDNLDILREYIPDESVDLIYLDPPFNSKQAYNIIFKDKNGKYPPSQIEAFDDTWHWGDENEEILVELTKSRYPPELVQMLHAFRSFLGNLDMMSYLVMMAIRLWEMRRVLKPTGSIYLHCDPTASHYLKILLDRLFGVKNFRNEIIWRRTGAHGKINRYTPIHDVILFYSKTDKYLFYEPKKAYMRGHVDKHFIKDERGYKTNYFGNVLTGSGIRGGESGKPWRGFDPTKKGRHWAIPGKIIDEIPEDLSGLSQHAKLDKLLELGYIKIIKGQAWPIYELYLKPGDGQPVPDTWAYQPYTEGTVFGTEKGIDADVRWLSPHDKERSGFQTQKPVALLERIIKASSNAGDVVLDPFCGCGTTVIGAEKLSRRWIGIDITVVAVNFIEKRLRENFPDAEYKVVGVPTDVPSAERLAADDKFDFEKWFVTAQGGQPYKSSGGGDTGIDGFLYAHDVDGGTHRIIVSVKGGGYGPAAVRDLKGVVEREGAIAGLILALKKPSKQAEGEAAGAGRFQMPGLERSYPKVQVFTVEDYFAGKRPDLPDTSGTLKKAGRVKREREKDQELPLRDIK